MVGSKSSANGSTQDLETLDFYHCITTVKSSQTSSAMQKQSIRCIYYLFLKTRPR